MNTCPACNAENEPAAMFCGQCGAALPRPPGAAGAPVGPTAQQPPFVPPTGQLPVHGMATAALIFGLLGLCCLLPVVGSIAGIVLGILALRNINENPETYSGKPLAISGIVASSAGLVILLMIVASTTNILNQAFPRMHGNPARCISNEKQLALATVMYAQDYDSHYPLAMNWNDGIYPYVKNTTIFSCPAVGTTVPNYAMNRALAQVKSERVMSPASAVLLFDSRIAERNVTGDISLVDYRHEGGYNAAFADGHVKTVKPSEGGMSVQFTPMLSNR